MYKRQGRGIRPHHFTGIRTGVDVFKALALGADSVLIGRPFVPAVYGGEAEGAKLLFAKLKAELVDTRCV